LIEDRPSSVSVEDIGDDDCGDFEATAYFRNEIGSYVSHDRDKAIRMALVNVRLKVKIKEQNWWNRLKSFLRI
jgi:hypothetical protein